MATSDLPCRQNGDIIGGPTQTYALATGSPAIDSGNNSFCPTTDQRGLPRPSDGNGDGSTLCDRGAYEVQGASGKANITILVEPTPRTPLNFRVYGPFGSFLLDNPETDDNDGVVQSVRYSVVPGSYNFTENKPTGWFVMEIRCDRPELATVYLAQFSVNLAVKAGDQVQCRFFNAASATVETYYSNDEFLAAYGGELPSEEEVGGNIYLPLIEN